MILVSRLRAGNVIGWVLNEHYLMYTLIIRSPAVNPEILHLFVIEFYVCFIRYNMVTYYKLICHYFIAGKLYP